LPEGAVILGSSGKDHQEIWAIGDNVLCFQSSPELNKTFVVDLIINKLYDIGKIDDKMKNQSLEEIDDEVVPMSRHFMMKCIRNYLRTPNIHQIKIQKEKIIELKKI